MPRSRSWLEPTKDNILKVAKKLGIASLPKLTRKEGETDQHLYERYLENMTGLPPCLICNGPQERRLVSERKELVWEHRKQTWSESWSQPKCILYSIHSAALYGKTPEEIDRNLGPVCQAHGYYMTECSECATKHMDGKKV